MIKGCHKKIVHLKDTGSQLFEEAYFVLKPEACTKTENDVISEATKIVNGIYEENSNERRKRGGLGKALAFFVGALLGGGAMLIIHFALI